MALGLDTERTTWETCVHVVSDVVWKQEEMHSVKNDEEAFSICPETHGHNDGGGETQRRAACRVMILLIRSTTFFDKRKTLEN